jgi:hypothetical protein
MILHEAYLKAKSEQEKKGFTLLVSCADYGDFWGFYFRPPTEKEINGISDITVNKETGEIGYFIPPLDLDVFDKRKPIPVELFAEYNVAV